MHALLKNIAGLFIVVSVAAMPVVSVLASVDAGLSDFAQDAGMSPCHEIAPGDHAKNMPATEAGIDDCCTDNVCTDCNVCFSCTNAAQSPAMPLAVLSTLSSTGDNHKSKLPGIYSSLTSSPAFRPPIR